MSTPARYVAAWGFHTPFFKLYKAAYAWQQTKLFRLIKLRLQNTPQSPDSITLASLPNELLDMIEVEVFNQAMRNAYKHMPQSGCDCEDLMDEFRQLSDVEEDFEDFCLAGPGMKRSEEKWEEFRKTATYETMWKSYKSYHAEACESWASTNQRWRELLSVCASGTKYGDSQMLFEFLADFGMELPLFALPKGNHYDSDNSEYCSDYDDFDFYEYDKHPVLLTFLANKCWFGSRPKNIVPGPFVINKKKLRSKLRIYGILPKAVKEEGEARARIPWEWSLRNYYGNPVDLSGNKLVVKAGNGKSTKSRQAKAKR